MAFWGQGYPLIGSCSTDVGSHPLGVLTAVAIKAQPQLISSVAVGAIICRDNLGALLICMLVTQLPTLLGCLSCGSIHGNQHKVAEGGCT